MIVRHDGYEDWMCEQDADGNLIRNYYGRPIVRADQFMEEHRAIVLPMAGFPPECTCGWTRHDGYELCDHLADQFPAYTPSAALPDGLEKWFGPRPRT
jgi:hypothetical protein